LYKYLSEVERQLSRLLNVKTDKDIPASDIYIDFAAIKKALERTGSNPLNVEGLLGKLAEAQLAALLVVSAEPPASSYPVGTMMVLTGTPDVFKYCKAGTPNTWQAISTTPTNMMTTDTAQTVTSAAIKTVQASWLFVVDQLIQAAENGTLSLIVNNTDGAGTGAVAMLRSTSSGANIATLAHGGGRVATRAGITLANWVELFSSAGNGIMISSSAAVPIVFVNNNTERGRIEAAGGWTFKTLATFDAATGAILIKPLSAPTANTKLFDLQTSAGSSVASIDEAGDAIFHDLNLTGALSGVTNYGNLVGTDINVTSGNYGMEIGGGFIFDTTAVSDVITVTESGASRFTVDNDGNVDADGSGTFQGDLIADNIDARVFVRLGNGASALYSGTGAPGAIGANGDFYFRDDAGGAGQYIYYRSGGVWTGIL
jgi:hypothetical protein